MEKAVRYSKKREAILEAIRSTKSHPSADWVYQTLKPTHPDLSLGTVYRNLSLLSDLGEIQKISTGAGPDRFDGNPRPHCHFQCRQCYSVLDIPFEHTEALNAHVSKDFPGIIEGNSVQFYGLCPNCIETH